MKRPVKSKSSPIAWGGSGVNFAALPVVIRRQLKNDWAREFQKSRRFKSVIGAMLSLAGGGMVLLILIYQFPNPGPVAIVASTMLVAAYIVNYVGIGLPYGRFCLTRLAKLGCCAKCGYDLRATPERCPECGAIVAEVKA
ncbi:MAG: hypothetical protein JWN40_5685 [Phycisphaerales bacterium]|nr:hypothetical protein [Phycisphaerales bacterium]